MVPTVHRGNPYLTSHMATVCIPTPERGNEGSTSCKALDSIYWGELYFNQCSTYVDIHI